jgi:hypothetical protein
MHIHANNTVRLSVPYFFMLLSCVTRTTKYVTFPGNKEFWLAKITVKTSGSQQSLVIPIRFPRWAVGFSGQASKFHARIYETQYMSKNLLADFTTTNGMIYPARIKSL